MMDIQDLLWFSLVILDKLLCEEFVSPDFVLMWGRKDLTLLMSVHHVHGSGSVLFSLFTCL